MCQSINLIKGDLKVFNFLHYRYVSICNLIKNEKFLQLKIFKYQKMFQNDFEAQNRKSLKRETMELKIVKNISYSSWSIQLVLVPLWLGIWHNTLSTGNTENTKEPRLSCIFVHFSPSPSLTELVLSQKWTFYGFSKAILLKLLMKETSGFVLQRSKKRRKICLSLFL